MNVHQLYVVSEGISTACCTILLLGMLSCLIPCSQTQCVGALFGLNPVELQGPVAKCVTSEWTSNNLALAALVLSMFIARLNIPELPFVAACWRPEPLGESRSEIQRPWEFSPLSGECFCLNKGLNHGESGQVVRKISKFNSYLYRHFEIVVIYMEGVANQSETKSHIFYCVTAKSRIIHIGTHEHHTASSSLTHIPLLN